MNVIQNPMKIPELDIKPDPQGGIELSQNMQQVLSTLAGFWKYTRVLLKASPSGILYVGSPPIEDIIHATATSANYAYQGSNIPCSEIMVMGHPSNGSKIWVRTKQAATVDNSWPLDANDVISIGITNLNMLHILIVADTEKAIIAYTL